MRITPRPLTRPFPNLSGVAVAVVLLCCYAGCGCLSPKEQFDPEVARSAYVPFLREGQTKSAELQAQLGEPTVRLKDSRILAYDLLFMPNRALGSVVYSPWFAGPQDRREYLRRTGRVVVYHHNPPDPYDSWNRLAEWSLVAEFDKDDRLTAYRISLVWPLPRPWNQQ